MGSFNIPINPYNYDLGDVLDLPNCDYVLPGDDYKELLSSTLTDLKVMQLNLRGLLNKQDCLKTLLHEHKVDVALLCETWLNNNTEKLVKIPNYKIYTIHRVDKIGGGVCILSNCKLRSRHQPDLNVETNLLEHCVVKLKTDTRNILLVSGYRPPNCNVRTFLKEYNNLVSKLKKNKSHQIIIGIDHNLDILKANSHPQTNEFLEMNLRKSLIPCISRPTRITHSTASLIDNIMASPILQCNYTPYILVDDISDHRPLMVKFRNQNKMLKGLETIKHRKLDTLAIEKINHDMASENWALTLADLDTNNSFSVFHQKLFSSIDQHAPEKTLKVGRNSMIRDPWITNGIIKSLRHQKQIYKEMLISKTDVSTFRYRDYRNCLKRLIRKNRQNYLLDKCKEFRQNGKKLWQLINRIIGKENNKLNTIESLKVDNITKYDSDSIINSFNEFFSNVGENLARQQVASQDEIEQYMRDLKTSKSSMFLFPTTSIEILRLIETLPNKTSSGYDNISNILLKTLSRTIIVPLEIIFNKSIEEGIFPEDMKKADIVPLYKCKDKQECLNYRPISLLITLSKLLEKLIHKRVYLFLEKSGQIFPSQYGFRTAHSCENAVSELLSTIIKGKDEGLYTISLFLDLSKAFDSLDHGLMISKLESYGICGNAFNWFKSYLCNRMIRTKCHVASSEQVEYSKYQPIKYGTPQGSCLGPLLFLIFTNDLHKQLHHCSCILFADDTTLYKAHRNLIYLQWCIQDDMNRIMKYFRINKLTLNLSKTVCVLFQKNKQCKEIKLQLDTHTITKSPEAKLLGMTLNQNLNWSSHVNQLVLKLNRNLNLLKLSRNMMNKESKLLVYCSHLESHIQYGILL